MIINSIPMAPQSAGGIQDLSPICDYRYIPCDLQTVQAGAEFNYIMLHPNATIWNGTTITDNDIGLTIEPWDSRGCLKITYDGKSYILQRAAIIKFPQKITLSENVVVGSDVGPIGLIKDIMNVDDIKVEEGRQLPDTPITLQEGAQFQYFRFLSNSITSSDITYSGFFVLSMQPYYKKIEFGGRAGAGSFVNTNITTQLITLPKKITIPTGSTIQQNANNAIEAC